MKILGFTTYNIDYVVKFGGSLLEEEEACRHAIHGLITMKEKGLRILIILGGGSTDNTIERLDKRHSFASDTHHRACASAQDQTDLMIADPFRSLCYRGKKG